MFGISRTCPKSVGIFKDLASEVGNFRTVTDSIIVSQALAQREGTPVYVDVYF